MKELILVRHAKSSWADVSLADFDRPLNERGKKDAPMMAQKLFSRGVRPQLFVSSPSKRTRSTCKFFLHTFDKKMSDVLFLDHLYDADSSEMMKIVKNLPEPFSSIIMFTHNTGLTDFVNELTNVHVDNVPTCGVFGVKIETDTWKNFPKAHKKFWFFDYPKLYI